MTLPNFIIIGAAKCGTTSLCHYLDQHPQIFMSPEKEPRFFAPEFYTKYTNGPVRRGSLRPKMSWQEYKGLFKGVKNEKAIGEASTEYLFLPEVSKRIKSALPDVKLITILRNPADRAFSAYCYQLRDGCENLSFSEALADEEKRTQENWRPGWLYKQNGFYFEQLSRYFSHFEKHQIKIYLYEELDSKPLETLASIFNFLEVSLDFVPDLSRKNVSAVPKNLFLNQLLSHQSLLYELKTYFPKPVKLLSRYIKQKNRSPKPNLPNEIRKQLVDIYREDILKLQDLIDRDLSNWMSY